MTPTPVLATLRIPSPAALAALTDDEITALALRVVGELHGRKLDSRELLEPLLEAVLRGERFANRLEQLRTATTPTGPCP